MSKDQRNTARLIPSYIRGLLSVTLKLPATEITEEMVNIKKHSIILNRKLKEMREVL